MLTSRRALPSFGFGYGSTFMNHDQIIMHTLLFQFFYWWDYIINKNIFQITEYAYYFTAIHRFLFLWVEDLWKYLCLHVYSWRIIDFIRPYSFVLTLEYFTYLFSLLVFVILEESPCISYYLFLVELATFSRLKKSCSYFPAQSKIFFFFAFRTDKFWTEICTFWQS